MVSYKFYHSLLIVLNQLRHLAHNKESNFLGVSFKDLENKFGLNERQILHKAARLILDKEIEYHNAHNIVGLYLTHKGEVACAEKKYLNERKKVVVSNIKDVIQIAIPVLALALSFVIYCESKTKIHKIEERMSTIENKK